MKFVTSFVCGLHGWVYVIVLLGLAVPIPIWKGVAVNISRWYTLPINIWCSISIVCHNRQRIESYTLRWKIPCMERRVYFFYHIFGFVWCVEGSNCVFKSSEKKPYYICIIREFHFQTSDVGFFSVVTVGGDCIGGLRNFLTNNITHKQHND